LLISINIPNKFPPIESLKDLIKELMFCSKCYIEFFAP